MHFLRRRAPQIAAVLSGFGLLAAAGFPWSLAEDRLLLWETAAVLTVALVGLTGALACFSGSRLRALRLASPAILLSASSFLYLLIVETVLGRCALTALVMGLTAVFFENWRRAEAAPEHPDHVQLMHPSLVLDAVSFFFLMAFIFGISAFYRVPLIVAAVAVGSVAAFLTH